jgi:hypothetical protein
MRWRWSTAIPRGRTPARADDEVEVEYSHPERTDERPPPVPKDMQAKTEVEAETEM